MNLLLMSPSKLKTLFDEIESNESIKQLNLAVIGNDYLTMNHAKIMERFETLKQEEISLKYVPLSFFQCTDAEFEEFVHDVVTDPELRVRFYIEDVLDMDYDKLKHR